MLNLIVRNKTDYFYKNEFGIKFHIRETKEKKRLKGYIFANLL